MSNYNVNNFINKKNTNKCLNIEFKKYTPKDKIEKNYYYNKNIILDVKDINSKKNKNVTFDKQLNRYKKINMNLPSFMHINSKLNSLNYKSLKENNFTESKFYNRNFKSIKKSKQEKKSSDSSLEGLSISIN